MAPGRRRGARAGAKRELSLGDLVLAKVKGFPAWPAKISRPEDWKKTPDPKKHFVVFFGTSEIAFVAPGDIQEFTHEVKKKLCDRGKGKTGKHYDQALKQICEEFEKLQPTNTRTGRDANCSQALASDEDSLDQLLNEDNAVSEKDASEIRGPSSSLETTRSTDVPSASENGPHAQSKVSGDSHVKEEGGSSDDQSDLQNGHNSITARGQTEKTKGKAHRNQSSAVGGAGDLLQKKASVGCSLKGTSPDIFKSSTDAGNDRNGNRLVVDDLRGSVNEESKRVMTRRKVKPRASRFGIKYQASRGRALNSRKNKITGAEASAHESKDSINEDLLPPAKRYHRAVEATRSAVENSDVKSMMSPTAKANILDALKVQSPVFQLPKKRRAVRLCDTDDDELPKTPVHGGLASKSIARASGPKNKKVKHGENSPHSNVVAKKSATFSFAAREQMRSREVYKHLLSPVGQRTTEKQRKQSSDSFRKKESSISVLQFDKISSLDAKPDTSTKGPPHSIGVTMKNEELKIQHSDTELANISQKGTPGINCSSHSAGHETTSFAKKSHNETNKPASSDNHVISPVERIGAAKEAKTNHLGVSQISDSVMSMKHLIAAAQERKRQARTLNSYGYPLLFIPDAEMSGCSPSPSSAAQALESGYKSQLSIQGSLPTFPESDSHPYSSNNQNGNEELDEKKVISENQCTGSNLSGDTEASVARDAFEGMIETLSRTKESIGRATRHAIDCAKFGIANEVVELLIRKLESEPSLHRKVDLFFLVDSITQCSHSQRGIAGASYIPVVKAALPRLVGAAAPSGSGAKENRRQCLKVLRLWLERKILPESVLRSCIDDIGQAQDDASTGRSLRRPSRSERAIDDPIREMEGIVVDEYGSNATFQLPGLLSGHAFEEGEEEEEEEYEETLPTILGTEIQDTPSRNSPVTSEGHGNHVIAPSERRHCILQDVDGELEMEDVSGKDEKILSTVASLALPLKPSSESEGILRSPYSISSDSESSPEGPPPLPAGSPPPSPPLPESPPPTLSSPPLLPASSPPHLPPLPPSQPLGQPSKFPQVPSDPPLQPPIAPPLPSVAPHPNRAPPLVNPPPPTGAPPMVPVAPPAWPPLAPNALPPLPFGPPPQGPPIPAAGPPPSAAPPLSSSGHPPPAASHKQVISQPSFVGHPPIRPQHLPQVPPAVSHAPQLAYQPPRLQHDIGGFSSVNQSSHDSSIRSEVLSQQSSCFPSSGTSAPVESVGYPSRPHGDPYMSPQVPQQWQHFHPGGVPFAQGPGHPEVRPVRAPSHFSYLNNTSHQSQHPRHSSTNISDGTTRYPNDDKRWTQTNQSNADCPKSGWIPGGRPHSGYFGSTFERPPANSITFHHPASNPLPPPSQIQAHGVPMMPYRADSSSLNWRPS